MEHSGGRRRWRPAQRRASQRRQHGPQLGEGRRGGRGPAWPWLAGRAGGVRTGASGSRHCGATNIYSAAGGRSSAGAVGGSARREREEAPDVVGRVGRVRHDNIVRRQALRPEDLIKVLALVVYPLEAQGPQVPRDRTRAVVGVVDAQVGSAAAERRGDDVERRREVRVGLGRALAVVVGFRLEGEPGGVPRARVP